MHLSSISLNCSSGSLGGGADWYQLSPYLGQTLLL